MDAVEIVSNVAEARDQRQRRPAASCSSATCKRAADSPRSPTIPGPKMSLSISGRSRPRKKRTPVSTTSLIRNMLIQASPQREIRVRVSNDANSTSDEFQLAWVDDANKPIGDPTPAYVPAGESRIVRVPRPADAGAATRLHLTGDNDDFDNTTYLAARPDAATSVLYIGDDRADDAKGLRYYLERALTEGASHAVAIATAAANKPLPLESHAETPLAVVTTSPPPIKSNDCEIMPPLAATFSLF